MIPAHDTTPLLTDDERQALLAVARAAITAEVTAGPRPPLPARRFPDASGAFVTVRIHGELRGCLGTLECREGALGVDIARCAADAVSRDPRFPPVSVAELPVLDIDVSVLGPLEQIDPRAADAIVVGQHGLVVTQGRRRGLLLPQVATEWSWTPAQFLRQTCVKAGLPPEAWQHGAQVFRFEADVFADDAPAAD